MRIWLVKRLDLGPGWDRRTSGKQNARQSWIRRNS
jgi:hypothetical protein